MRLGKAEWTRGEEDSEGEERPSVHVMDRAVFQGFSDVSERTKHGSPSTRRPVLHFVLRAYVARVALGVRRHRRVSRYSQRDDSETGRSLQRPAPEAAVILALPERVDGQNSALPRRTVRDRRHLVPGCSRWDVFA